MTSFDASIPAKLIPAQLSASGAKEHFIFLTPILSP
jgi:hypothetical protein